MVALLLEREHEVQEQWLHAVPEVGPLLQREVCARLFPLHVHGVQREHRASEGKYLGLLRSRLRPFWHGKQGPDDCVNEFDCGLPGSGNFRVGRHRHRRERLAGSVNARLGGRKGSLYLTTIMLSAASSETVAPLFR